MHSHEPLISYSYDEGPHQCIVCGREFARKDHLRRHVVKHLIGTIDGKGEVVRVKKNVRSFFSCLKKY